MLFYFTYGRDLSFSDSRPMFSANVSPNRPFTRFTMNGGLGCKQTAIQ